MLWVAISVQDPEWRPPAAGREIGPTELDPSDMFDDVILVVDLTAGAVLAQRRFDKRVVPMGGAVYTTRMTDDGIYVVEVNRPRLVR